MPELGPGDGLAICNASAVAAGVAALALESGEQLLDAGEIAAALSMEGFRASVWPIAADVAGAHPAPGQEWQAAGLRELLQGGSLLEPGAARRLQDPLSFRCASHVHGALRSALDLLAAAVIAELNGAGDNPLVLPGGEVVSTGNFHTPALALALDATAIALAQTAAQVAERPARLATERLSGLPANLTPEGNGRSGVAPLLKTAQALAVEIRHLAAPFAIDPQLRRRRRRGRLHQRRRRRAATGRPDAAARPPDRARARVRGPGGRSGRARRARARARPPPTPACASSSRRSATIARSAPTSSASGGGSW